MASLIELHRRLSEVCRRVENGPANPGGVNRARKIRLLQRNWSLWQRNNRSLARA